MGIFSQIKGPITGVLNDLMADTDLSEEVTYKKYVSQTFNEAEGYPETTYSSSTITAIRLRQAQESAKVAVARIAKAGQKIEAGDVLFLIKGEDAPADMSHKDILVDENDEEYKIKTIDYIFGIAVSISCEGGSL